MFQTSMSVPQRYVIQMLIAKTLQEVITVLVDPDTPAMDTPVAVSEKLENIVLLLVFSLC